MADLNALFQIFDDNISLSRTQDDKLRQGRDALRDIIKKWFTDNDKPQPKFCWQGSFAMKTTVNPILGEYDLDDGVYLSGYENKPISTFPTPDTVHSWIKNATSRHTKEEPIDKKSCVRVVYQAGYHIDYPIYIDNSEKNYLATTNEGWIISNPTEFVNWFVEKVKNSDEQLRRIVKYIKAWKDYNNIDLKGVEITILAANNYYEFEGHDENSLRETITRMLVSLTINFVCQRPVEPYENLFEGKSQAQKDEILSKLQLLKEKLDKSISEEDEEKASKYMIEIFGDRFPKGKPPTTDKGANFERTNQPAILHHDGRSAKTIKK